MIARSGQKGLSRFVRRTSRLSTRSLASPAAGIVILATRLRAQRLKLRWTPSVANSARQGDVTQLVATHHATNDKTAATHVAGSDEVGRKHKAVSEHRNWRVHVFPRRDADG